MRPRFIFSAALVLLFDVCRCDVFELRKKLSLRAGVLHAPPFAIRNDDGTYAGFQPDLLDRLKIFAAEDGVDLEFVLSDAPAQYGSALDLIANDCNTTENPNLLQDCRKFDLIVGDYYCNPSRSVRIDFTPTWLRTTMSGLKYVHRGGRGYDTMMQLEAAEDTACVPDGTYLMNVVMEKYPRASYYKCPSPLDCIEKLKSGTCALYVDDELQLRYRAMEDLDVEVGRDDFNTQYIVWPMSYNIGYNMSQAMKKWMYSAVANATLDELYYTYFEVKTCPIGTAGENCTDYCDPKHGQANRDGLCVCESNSWTGKDCSVEVQEDLQLLSPALIIVGYTFFGINVAIVMFCAVWLLLKRNWPQVRVAQPFFLGLVLLGVLVSQATILVLMREDPGDGPVPACVTIPWFYSVGFCITYGTLFAKIRRVHRLFRASARMVRARVTAKDTLLQIGSVLFIDVIILSVWTGVDQLYWERTVLMTDVYRNPLSSQGYCTSDHWPVFVGLIATLHFGLLAVACYMCYVTRHIPAKFSEGQYLSLVMLSNLQIFLIGIPVLVIAGTDPASSFFVRSAIIFINNLVVLGLIFGNLIYSVMTNRGNVSTRSAISSFVSQGDRNSVNLSSHSITNDSGHRENIDNQANVLSASNHWAAAYGSSDKGECSQEHVGGRRISSQYSLNDIPEPLDDDDTNGEYDEEEGVTNPASLDAALSTEADDASESISDEQGSFQSEAGNNEHSVCYPGSN
eukprot:CAMPEP_0113567734 /NCGR_PEP_ID=MMETSP0015_2-20120614/23442_1 /TAXON_ID=2838 /ORGANISM="Odontella" /LENGTH=737 /DNA_ID=CAMNT_0000470165 /DNA_START=104 /DNA_END=2317 /DNA_ORIENTATION=+ /assembly_acc=CAM_ASM_000160